MSLTMVFSLCSLSSPYILPGFQAKGEVLSSPHPTRGYLTCPWAPPWSSRDPRGCLHANPPASQIRTQGDWSEGILLGRPSGTERGMSPLPSLLTFEKDRIRRKVNVTLLFSWEPGKRKADPEFWLLQVQWWCWGAGHEVTAGWGARAGLGSCNGAFWD